MESNSESRLIRVDRKEVEDKLKSKDDLYKILKVRCKLLLSLIGKYFVPGLSQCTLKFLTDLSTGEKKVKLMIVINNSICMLDRLSQ